MTVQQQDFLTVIINGIRLGNSSGTLRYIPVSVSISPVENNYFEIKNGIVWVEFQADIKHYEDLSALHQQETAIFAVIPPGGMAIVRGATMKTCERITEDGVCKCSAEGTQLDIKRVGA